MRSSQERGSGCGIPRALRPVLVLLALAIMLPLAASAYISTGPAYDRSWYWQNQTPQGNDLLGEAWADANTGYVVGYGGTVLKTLDGGANWTSLDATTTKRLTGATFVDANNGWVVGYSAVIRHTRDGGTTWVSEIVGGGNNLQAVSAFDSNDAIAVGDKTDTKPRPT